MPLPKFETDRKKYLLIPSVPTPNGRLHLGHIGGPYLSADIFARHMQRFGHQASIIVGTDSYESYVMAQAAKEEKEPAELCHYYHQLIQQDLAEFHIQTNAMINPIDRQWQDRYKHWQLKILENLQQENAMDTMTETVLWNSLRQRYETGCWIKGNCPSCNGVVAGYFCEGCGAHFRPEEIRLSKEFLSQPLTQENVSNYFMRIPETFTISHRGISPSISNAYQHFLQKQRGLFRLTANAEWGISLPAVYSLSRCTLFNYGLMFAYFLLMGEVYGEQHGNQKNAFAHDSDVITLSSFGFDNAVPFLASILGVTEHCKTYKPFDYYLVNYFYNYNGSKFSTSRNHAIWATDIAQRQGHSVDITRLFLALIDVRQHPGNFDDTEFLHFDKQMTQWINTYITVPLSTIKYHDTSDDSIMYKLSLALTQQQQVLRPEHFFPHLAAKLVLDWQENMESALYQSNYHLWLKGWALLAYPLMPKLSVDIWQQLGNPGKPTITDY